MRLRNRRGTPVDPVPFFVVSGLGFALAFTYGPGYLLALGASLGVALAGAAAAFAATVAVAYRRYVWTATPDVTVPAAVRFQRLCYGALLAGAALVLLALPLVAP
ncbi:MAG: hypothetical protein ABEJ31_10120 [Haloarculaceae archaeon]